MSAIYLNAISLAKNTNFPAWLSAQTCCSSKPWVSRSGCWCPSPQLNQNIALGFCFFMPCEVAQGRELRSRLCFVGTMLQFALKVWMPPSFPACAYL